MKKTKLIFGIIVTVILMMIIIPTAFAAEEDRGVIFENVQWGPNSYATLYDDYTLVVSGTGCFNAFDWFQDDDSVLANNLHLVKKIIIGEGITYDEQAGDCSIFLSCSRLEEITFPKSFQYIDMLAFYNCKTLTKVTINGAFYIGEYAFFGCTSLTSIDLPENLTTIGEVAFQDCTSLASIDLPENLTTIEGDAFSGCTSLTSIDLPESLTTIGSYAFENCYMIKSITIPANVTNIGGSAFAGCGYLEQINIPAGVESIGSGLLNDCIRLKKVVIENPDAAIEWSRTTIPEQAVIWGYEGSTAETYAEYWMREFRVIGSEDDSDSEGGSDNEDNGEVKPHEHKFPEEWIVLSEATCTQNGISIRICEGCNEIQSQNNYAYGHNDEDGDGKCDECSVVVSVPEITDTPENPEKPDEESKGSVWDTFVNFFAQIRVFIDSIIAIFKF